jgi:Uma2 family endonuclease
MVQAAPRDLTLEDFLKLPETKPASEFINGQIIQKPMPQAKHSAIQGDFVPAVNQVLRPNHLARAFPELRCTFGGRSVVPDIAVLTWNRIVRDADGEVANQVEIAPDWTIEILSPDQSQSKVVRNILHCLNHGTAMGWLIDPDEKLIFVYGGDRPVVVFEAPDPTPMPVPDFANAIQLSAYQVFSWLLD